MATTISEASSAPPSDDPLDPLNPKITFKDEKELLAWANAQFERCKKNRLPFERQWYMNIAFFMGKHYVQWAPGANGINTRLYEPKAPPWRVRLVSNKIRRYVRSELARITKERPQMYVIPASTEENDRAAARAGEAIAEHQMRELVFNRVMRRMSFWELLTGTGFTKDWYDPNEVQEEGDDIEAMMSDPNFDPSQVDLEQLKMPVTGKLHLEHVSTFHIWIPEPQIEEIEDQPYVIHGSGRSADWVASTYGKVLPAESQSGSEMLEQRFLSSLGVASAELENVIFVKEMWIKPCRRFPKGAVLHWANETLLALLPMWPYTHKEYPFTKFDHIPAGRFYATSTIEDLIPLQREYNRARSQVIESKNRMSRPQLMAFRGSVDVSKMTSEPGLVIQVTPGFPLPEPVSMQNLPGYVMENIQQIVVDMDDTASQYEVSKGRTPPGITAASAIAYLQEQNDTILSPTVASIEEGIEKIGRHILFYVQQYWDEPRKIRVMGVNGLWETHEFSKADLNGNTDLRIEAGSAAPRSKAAKQAFLLEIGKLGWIPPDRLLKYLEMNEAGKLYEEIQTDARQAQRENIKMTEMGKEAAAQQQQMQQQQAMQSGLLQPPQQTQPPGQPVGMPQEPQIDPATGQPMTPGIPNLPINDYDVDPVHLMTHGDFCKSQEYEMLDDLSKQIHLNHYRAHAQRSQMQQAAAMQQQNPQPQLQEEGVPSG